MQRTLTAVLWTGLTLALIFVEPLEAAMKKLRLRKAVGPDEIPNELLLHLSFQKRLYGLFATRRR